MRCSYLLASNRSQTCVSSETRRTPGARPGTCLPSRTVRDAAELLPRYAVDNIFVSDKFKARFPDFRVTTFREGLAPIREEYPAEKSGSART